MFLSHINVSLSPFLSKSNENKTKGCPWVRIKKVFSVSKEVLQLLASCHFSDFTSAITPLFCIFWPLGLASLV